jgi:hypothetical protein
MIRQSCQDVGEPGARIDVIELAGFDEGVDSGGALAAAVGAGEGPVVPAHGDAAQGALGGIVGQIDPSVIEEAIIAVQRFRLYWIALAIGFFEESLARSARSQAPSSVTSGRERS